MIIGFALTGCALESGVNELFPPDKNFHGHLDGGAETRKSREDRVASQGDLAENKARDERYLQKQKDFLTQTHQNKDSWDCRPAFSVITSKSYNDEDKKLVTGYFARNGFNDRDIELLVNNEWGTIGTGMSGLGIKCLGFNIVNNSFYSGSGHQWQMQRLGEGSYVYLKGDGTDKGMIVDAWN